MLEFGFIDINVSTTPAELNEIFREKNLALWFIMDINGRVKRLWYAERSGSMPVVVEDELGRQTQH